ncbi:MAG: PEGA domain-containing protein [Myxococcota bacterium]|nr:PEGA domain-containing protein [Myxococcota bacterium]
MSALLVLSGPAMAEEAAEGAADEPRPTRVRDDVPTGMLYVKSPAASSEVYIDNVLVGTAPLNKSIPAGSHTVRVTADNYDPFVRRVEVTPGVTQDVIARLSPGSGTVEFFVTPKGAKVTLDDQDELPTPVRLRELTQGRHVYRIEAPGHEPRDGSFDFQTGRNLLITHELRSSAGIVQITSSPPGATIRLDDTVVGQTPLTLEDVSAGPHAIRLDLRRYATVFRLMDTSDGSRGHIEARLPRTGSQLTVHTGRRYGRVYLQGSLAGSGRHVHMRNLERGIYRIKVEAAGFIPLESQIDVPPMGRKSFRTDLVADGSGVPSQLAEVQPLFKRWTFWTGAGIVAVGAGIGGYFVLQAALPQAIELGDLVVPLP